MNGKSCSKIGTKLQKCPIVRIAFKDHAMSSGEDTGLVNCEVFGVLFKETTDAYYVASWVCERSVSNPNTETFAILKHPGIKVTRL